MKKRLENSKLTKEELMDLLKEIHRTDHVDPSIESEVVNMVKHLE